MGMNDHCPSKTSTSKCESTTITTEENVQGNPAMEVDRRMSLTLNTTMRELMTSAAVDIYDSNRRLIRCRALLDTCSMANLIMEQLASARSLPKKGLSIPVGGLDNNATTTRHAVTATFKSIHNGFEKTLTFLTIRCISEHIPTETIKRESIDIPRNILLADPEFHKSTKIDLLIGSGPTLSMLCMGQIDLSGKNTDLVLQKTRLGWIIGGNVSDPRIKRATCLLADVQQDLTRFWELEDDKTIKHLSNEELKCEEHFRQYTTRDEGGRYVVALPFRDAQPNLGVSREGAIKRLNALGRRFKLNSDLRHRYATVIEEYLELGHMTECSINDDTGFYLPHHAVFKGSSTTTQVRVVFDASAKSSNGSSLNDTLMVGPTIQDDIFSIILRFRLHNYVITADIEKMYRQFLVRNEDRKYQKILWHGNDGLKAYELNTVTFGIASAPYLAIRCLHQLAEDEGDNYPAAARSIKRDMYVDDLLTGAQTISEAQELRCLIIALLKLGGLRLRKWISNEPSILDGLPEDELDPTFSFNKEESTKTLGIVWRAREDCIRYTVNPITLGETVTKRKILSEIARIFDPLGLLGPIILYGKLMMQKLWLLKLNWDESVPTSVYTDWVTYCEQLTIINDWSYKRQVMIPEHTEKQIHGFCDASEKGYEACIYIRSRDKHGNAQSRLFCSKSRVAPLKVISIPRLELCAAHLLAKLYSRLMKTIDMVPDKVFLWTDSMVSLHWINKSPHTLKTFVGNRVADIQGKTHSKDWRHISSQDNPADMLSRGQLPSDFMNNSLWANGPSWLPQEETTWPTTTIEIPDETPEARKIICLATTAKCDFFEKFSSFKKLRRVIAYCLRFKPNNKFKGTLQVEELNKAERKIIILMQAMTFKDEIHELNKAKGVGNKSKLKSLNAFIDKEGILRVGGRLSHAALPYEQQHPAILPRSHHITDLLIEHYHVQNHHSGIQTTLYSLRRRYWPIDGRNQVRRIIRRCIQCFRANPPTTDYTMGDLPAVRITQARVFSNVGVDYCGPFYIKEKKHRNRGKVKIYVAVFVCLVIKATHLEVVSDLTTEGFLGALRRFISRRGKPHTISSDNGTNFVGANNELSELYAMFNSPSHQDKTTSFLGEQGIQWKFIPPLSQNFGGLWESTVKTFKHHFKRVMFNELFTFEEFNTFAIEIEAILNSRPLTPLSTDPNDLLALTPGHFLIGESLTSMPTPDYAAIPTNRLSCWQHLQKIRQDFWTRWNKEYLNELNVRKKWTAGDHSIKEGTLVLLKEDHSPPMQWSMGRVIKVYPGTDGVVRTVTVKTANSVFDCNVRRLASLPTDEKDII